MENKKAFVAEPDLKSYSKEQIMSAAIRLAREEGYPMAVWRMPHQSEVNVLISFNKALELERYEMEELKNGFALAPFNFGEEKGLFLKADVIISFDFEEIVIKPGDSLQQADQLNQFKVSLIEKLEQPEESTGFIQPRSLTPSNASDYRELVTRCVEAIKDGFIEKVVPARTKDIQLPPSFDVVQFFTKLCTAYQNAFISFVSIPETGTWMGATPEVLIEREGHIFRTTALAATQRYNPENSLTETAWTQKEIEEQAMVSRYIINCFKRIRLREFSEKGPETIKAGNLLHLKTTLEVDLIATNFPELPTVMLELLHPTSAVAGMPREQALSFLKHEEKLDRSFYAGFLGPVNIEDKTNLFVNLRCMELTDEQARLYAGAGVTAHSNPEKEFAETEMKFNTLLNILNQSN
ncbi:isochorismate synthase [Roseivirga sp.]|uniref:isochorismate synthase n=1 Tax=Roseivirga sp. TaxID=1964215 RepID=UPI003B5178F3